jgi:hypothetical protein
MREYRKSKLRFLKITSEMMHNSTGLPVTDIERWINGKSIDVHTEYTIINLFKTVESEMRKMKVKLNLISYNSSI